MALNDNILDTSQLRENNFQPNIAEYTVSGMTRFGHYIIDSIVIYVIFFGIVIMFAGSGETFDMLLDDGNNTLTFIMYIPFLLYYPIMEFYFGKTVAKMLTKSTVVGEDGSKLTFGQAVGRSFCRLIPFDAFSFLGSTAVGWHDSISKTRVVKDTFLDHNLEYDRYSF